MTVAANILMRASIHSGIFLLLILSGLFVSKSPTYAQGCTAPPPPVSNLIPRPGPISPSRYDITWNPSSGATSYVVMVDDLSNPPPACPSVSGSDACAIVASPTTTYEFQMLIARSYFLRVTARNACGDSATVSHLLTPPVCPLAAAPNRTIATFSGGAVEHPNGPDSTTPPLNVNLPAGIYDITLASFDDHSDKGYQEQPFESWYVELRNASGTLIGTSDPVADIPDSEDWVIETVNSNFNLSSPVTEIVGSHIFYAHPSWNSVIPVCAAFDNVTACTDTNPPNPPANVQLTCSPAAPNLYNVTMTWTPPADQPPLCAIGLHTSTPYEVELTLDSDPPTNTGWIAGTPSGANRSYSPPFSYPASSTFTGRVRARDNNDLSGAWANAPASLILNDANCGGLPVCNNNGTQDNGETDIDCGGGGCPACPPPPASTLFCPM